MIHHFYLFSGQRYLLWCAALQSGRSFPTLQRNTLPLSSRLCFLPDSCWFLAWLTLQPWRWRWHVPPKLQSTFTGLHGTTSQKI
jgi:hypothetical protein